MTYKLTDFCDKETYVLDHLTFNDFVNRSESLGELDILESILNDTKCRVNAIMYNMLMNGINERRLQLDHSLEDTLKFNRPFII